MEESEKKKSVLDSFKSKKIRKSSAKSSATPSKPPTLPHQERNSLDLTEKSINHARRTRNRGAALSLKEVREAAQKLRKSDPGQPTQTDPRLTAAKEMTPHWPEASPSKFKEMIPQWSEASPSKSKRSHLPEKYELLDEFFRSLHNSIRLLGIKGSETTFTNIRPKIESFVDRTFTYNQLAQLKFILPEVIQINKILIYDERTNCMKPDLHVTLKTDAFDNDGKTKSESGNLHLRKVFRSRLYDFFRAHPEGDEIPEEVLPEPFNKSNKVIETKVSGSSLMSQTPTTASAQQLLIRSSCLPQSFRRHFSQRVADNKEDDTIEGGKTTSHHAVTLQVQEACSVQPNKKRRICVSGGASLLKSPSKPVSGLGCSSSKELVAKLPNSPPPATPVKDVHSYKSGDPSSDGAAVTMGAPPTPPDCTPAKMMSATPGLWESKSKRCYMSPEGDKTIQSPNKLVRRASRSRSLKFDTPKKGANFQDDVKESDCSSSDHNDRLDCLSESLVQSIKEKEKKALLEQDPAISQAKWRQKMIAGLPKFFDMVYMLFQSKRSSAMIKEDLLLKIVSSHVHIVDRREVEERLRLLQELVPEWIYEKLVSSGELLVCVNKIPCPQLIRTRLAEAN